MIAKNPTPMPPSTFFADLIEKNRDQQAEIDRLKAELSKVTTNPEASVFLLDKMPWEKEFTIRIHIPGIDGGSAFASDSEAGKTKEDAEALLSAVSAALRIPARREQLFAQTERNLA